MKIRERIEGWLENGIKGPDAIGVRGTSVPRIIGTALFGIQPGMYYLNSDEPPQPAIPFFPYLDRTDHPTIAKLRAYFELDDTYTEFLTDGQIAGNLEGYSQEHAIDGASEWQFLNFGKFSDNLRSTCKHRPESFTRETGISLKMADWILGSAKRRKGVQLALSERILEGSQIDPYEPRDSLIYGFTGWPSQECVSGIKVYTQLELDELRRMADDCDRYIELNGLPPKPVLDQRKL